MKSLIERYVHIMNTWTCFHAGEKYWCSQQLVECALSMWIHLRCVSDTCSRYYKYENIILINHSELFPTCCCFDDNRIIIRRLTEKLCSSKIISEDKLISPNLVQTFINQKCSILKYDDESRLKLLKHGD